MNHRELIKKLRNALAIQQTAPHYADVLMAADDYLAASDKPAQPYAWAVTGMATPFYGPFAEGDAKDAARRCGGTSRAFPLYTDDQKVAP